MKIKKEENVHYVWHSFCNYMKRWYYDICSGWKIKNGKIVPSKRKYKYFNSSKMVGYQAMCRVARYSKDKDGIFITGCDDNSHMGSDIVLITHECEDNFMGTTMILMPQSKQEINQVFLYPEHVDGLIKILEEIKERSKKSKLLREFTM